MFLQNDIGKSRTAVQQIARVQEHRKTIIQRFIDVAQFGNHIDVYCRGELCGRLACTIRRRNAAYSQGKEVHKQPEVCKPTLFGNTSSSDGRFCCCCKEGSTNIISKQHVLCSGTESILHVGRADSED